MWADQREKLAESSAMVTVIRESCLAIVLGRLVVTESLRIRSSVVGYRCKWHLAGSH